MRTFRTKYSQGPAALTMFRISSSPVSWSRGRGASPLSQLNHKRSLDLEERGTRLFFTARESSPNVCQHQAEALSRQWQSATA